MTDKDHLQNITKNPVNFLKQSGKGFFVDKEGYLIALKDEMQAVLQEGGTKFADEVKRYCAVSRVRVLLEAVSRQGMRREKAEIGNREQREGEKDTFLLR